jgi:hypothetical protein
MSIFGLIVGTPFKIRHDHDGYVVTLNETPVSGPYTLWTLAWLRAQELSHG